MSGTMRAVCEAHITATELKHLASAHHNFQTKLCVNIKFFLQGKDMSMETVISVSAVYRAEDLFF
jgi:hypothetical protein